MNQIFIGARHGERFFYTAKPNEDGTSIVVQRVIIEDGQESYETLANFIDAGIYAMSFLATNDNSYEVTKRIPNENYFEYELNIPEKFKEHYIECITPHERPMRVRYTLIFSEIEYIIKKYCKNEFVEGEGLNN